MASALWIAGICAVLAIVLAVAGYVTVEAQMDSRSASLPPDADWVLAYKTGYFDVSCITHHDPPRDLRLEFHTNLDYPIIHDYFWESKRDGGEIKSGAMYKAGERNPRTYFQIMNTGINGSNWYSYGVAYSEYPICTGGANIFDFELRGSCDGSTITMETSDRLLNMTQYTHTEHSSNYDAWCGYVPNPLGTLNNKIF